VLLALGALGALYFAAVLQQLPASLSTFSGVLGAPDIAIPSSVHTLSTVGVITVLAIYALNVVLSIHRLRARKLSFWVPLVAAAIAGVVVFAFASFAMNQVPELLQLFADPDAMGKLFEYASTQGAATP